MIKGVMSKLIDVSNLDFSYSKKYSRTLKGISFNVKKGEIFGLLGPSGAGKSTIQKILLGLLKEFSGEVQVNDKDVREITRKYYDDIGVGFELPNLYEQLTIYENLQSFSKLYSKPANISELLKRVGLYEHKDKKVSEISKGMKMRLNFCRSLIGSPEIIFLDEPTSGLDPNNTIVIQEMILEQQTKGKTIVLTTHNMNFAERICNRVAFIVDGEIKAIGSPQELKNKYGEKSVHIETRSGSYEYKIDRLGENKEFIKLLNEDIERIETRQLSLEDIFTIVTGRVLV